uniref:holo-ACP synthase n=1 Tax=uncultured Sphingomonas sp. TaxID=158754 RepID=UPI0035CB4780
MADPRSAGILGLGIDLIDLEHFRRLYGDDDKDVLSRCFTQGELEDAGDDDRRHERRAARFAAKEAFYKALGGGESIAHTDVETLRTATGAPVLRVHGAARALAAERGATTFLVSLTHTALTAGAVVVALSGPK